MEGIAQAKRWKQPRINSSNSQDHTDGRQVPLFKFQISTSKCAWFGPPQFQHENSQGSTVFVSIFQVCHEYNQKTKSILQMTLFSLWIDESVPNDLLNHKLVFLIIVIVRTWQLVNWQNSSSVMSQKLRTHHRLYGTYRQRCKVQNHFFSDEVISSGGSHVSKGSNLGFYSKKKKINSP